MTIFPGAARNGALLRSGTATLAAVLLAAALLEASGCTRAPREGPLAGPVSVTCGVDRAEALIGDRLRYSIRVRSLPGVSIRMPEPGDSLGGFSVRDRGELEPVSRPGESVREQWYLLETYETGAHTIPAPVVIFAGEDGIEKEASGQDVAVDVKSLIAAAGAEQDIRGIRGPVAVAASYRGVVGRALAGLLVAVALVAAAMRVAAKLMSRRPVARYGAAKCRLAHEIALEELEAIRAGGLLDERMAQEYYVRVSGTVRRYLEARFGLRAPEMTTEEFLQAVSSSMGIVPGHRALLDGFLRKSDMVKFARHGSTRVEMEDAYGAARRFVNETVPATEQPGGAEQPAGTGAAS